MSRKEAKPRRFSPPWWISPPHLKNKNQRPFSFLIRVKKMKNQKTISKSI